MDLTSNLKTMEYDLSETSRNVKIELLKTIHFIGVNFHAM